MKIKLHYRIVVSTPPHVHKSYLAQESGTSKKLKYISFGADIATGFYHYS